MKPNEIIYNLESVFILTNATNEPEIIVILTIWGNHNFFKVKNHKLLLEMPFQRVNWDNLNTKYGVATDVGGQRQ